MQTPTAQLRVLDSDDLAAAFELSAAAGWNQTTEDWSMLLALAPEGCFGIEADGELASTTTLVCYGRRLGWVGMVLTKPEYRGRGFARRLVAHALQHADSLGIETLNLDATEQGRGLYESFGFRSEQLVERWSRPGDAASHTLHSFSLSQDAMNLDIRAFGVDRSAMLAQLATRSEVYSDSEAFLFARAGRTTAYIGPCVASGPGPGRSLITKVVHASPGTAWSWDLLAKNGEAVALASALGFTRRRLLTRMARGKLLSGEDDMVFAIAGLELG
jgi:GNAT superfamily N-acetyltransferase